MAAMFLVTTSMVRPSSCVGLNSTTSVPAERTGDLALEDVAHVFALALVVRQALEQGLEVRVLGVGLERHGPASVEVLEMPFVALECLVF